LIFGISSSLTIILEDVNNGFSMLKLSGFKDETLSKESKYLGYT
jgi:hypothetical protein